MHSGLLVVNSKMKEGKDKKKKRLMKLVVVVALYFIFYFPFGPEVEVGDGRKSRRSGSSRRGESRVDSDEYKDQPESDQRRSYAGWRWREMRDGR